MIKLTDIYRSLLTEMASDIVYHGTHINKLVNILNSNSFELSPAVGTRADDEINKGKMYFFSTSRNRDNSFFTRRISDGHAILTLDGRKLNQNIKAVPVNYWGDDAVKDANDEMEDRFMSDKPSIDNATKFIKQIDVLVPTSIKYFLTMDRIMLSRDGYSDEEINDMEQQTKRMDIDDRFARAVRKVLLLTKKNDIPIYLYDDRKSFQYGNTNKAIDIPFDKLKTKPKTDFYTSGGDRLYHPIAGILQLYYEDDIDDLDSRTYDILMRGALEDNPNNIYTGELRTSLKNDIHNSRTRKNRYVSRLLKLIHKHGKSVDSLLSYLWDKWKPKLENR